MLDLSVYTVLCWTKAGTLPGVRLPGGALRYRGDEIDALLGSVRQAFDMRMATVG
jgi:predicted site-specific integrase-resolvase